MTYDEYAAKVDKHQYLGLYFGGSEDTYVAVPCEGANFYANIPLFTGQAPDRYAFISANSQNYDLALAFYNYMYDLDFCRMHYSGIQGTDWDYNEEGVPALTDASMEAIKNNDPYWSSNVEQGGKGYGDRVQAILGYNPGVAHTDGYPLNLQLMRDAKVKTQDELHTDVANTYGVECWSDAYTENENIKDFRNSGEGLGGMIEMPKDYQRTLEACNDVLYTAMPMLVMAESEEEFAEVREETLQEIADLGENEVWEWYQSAWEEPKEFYNALIKESIETQGMEPYEGLE